MCTISCIVPVYNVRKYLEECIDSILKQSYNDIEVIIVDDGSDDGSSSICDFYSSVDERVNVIHQKNEGLSIARNNGISIAKGDYIWFIDSDDAILKDSIKRIVNSIILNNSPDILFFEADTIFEIESDVLKKEQYYRNNKYGCGLGTTILEKLMENKEYFSSSCMYVLKREYLIDSNIRFIENIVHEDNAFTLCMFANAQRIVHLHESLYLRRVRAGSITQIKEGIKNIEGMIECIKYIGEKSRITENICKKKLYYREQVGLIKNIIVLIKRNGLSESIYRKVLGAIEFNDICKVDKLLTKKIILYGYGNRGHDFIESFGKSLFYAIWDTQLKDEAEQPEFAMLNDDYALVVCIDDFSIYEEIEKECCKMGFYNTVRWEELYLKLKCLNEAH